MFTGIVERIGSVLAVREEGTNKHFTIQTDIADELYIDQSIAHNGVCLTVVSIESDSYVVTAIKETLDRSNIGLLRPTDKVNIERSMTGTTRMDGHIVQGHVDDTVTCLGVEDVDGSWIYTFAISPEQSLMLVDKGSVCINGVSLTVVSPTADTFQVAIIPYTYEHTTFQYCRQGTVVNIEWDIIGKYVVRYMDRINAKN